MWTWASRTVVSSLADSGISTFLRFFSFLFLFYFFFFLFRVLKEAWNALEEGLGGSGAAPNQGNNYQTHSGQLMLEGGQGG